MPPKKSVHPKVWIVVPNLLQNGVNARLLYGREEFEAMYGRVSSISKATVRRQSEDAHAFVASNRTEIETFARNIAVDRPEVAKQIRYLVDTRATHLVAIEGRLIRLLGYSKWSPEETAEFTRIAREIADERAGTDS